MTSLKIYSYPQSQSVSRTLKKSVNRFSYNLSFADFTKSNMFNTHVRKGHRTHKSKIQPHDSELSAVLTGTRKFCSADSFGVNVAGFIPMSKLM